MIRTTDDYSTLEVEIQTFFPTSHPPTTPPSEGIFLREGAIF